MSGEVNAREWDYSPARDGEPFIDEHGNEILGWHDRNESQDDLALLAEFEAYFFGVYPDSDCSLTLRPILVRDATAVECRINDWEEGTFVRCTTRAKNPRPMWQIEVPATQNKEKG